MRTIINLDNDVLERARAVSTKLGEPFETVINRALRIGLDRVEEPVECQPYKTKPQAMGLKPGRNLDNIQELLAQIEGEESR
ncbi:MAG: hypothetical protein JXA42_09365 [Anaerolineales bacterium]|nr:hypothetical protein [Anaerolineales bacterium]